MEEQPKQSGMSKKAAVIMAGITGVSTLCGSTVTGSDHDTVIITVGGMAAIALMVMTHHICQTMIDKKKP